MWEIMPERLKEAMEVAGINQSQLAEAVGVKQPSIGRLLSGETKTTRAIEQIANTLNTTASYLKGETTEICGVKTSLPVPAIKSGKSSDTIEIAEFNISYGLGATFIDDAHVKSKARVFSRSWVRQFTEAQFDALFWATGNGISMMPAILDNDILLIDTSQQTPRMWDQIWAIDMGGMGMIKSLRPKKDGGMRIISLNPDWPEDTAYDGEMNVIGRVVAIVRKM